MTQATAVLHAVRILLDTINQQPPDIAAGIWALQDVSAWREALEDVVPMDAVAETPPRDPELSEAPPVPHPPVKKRGRPKSRR